MNLNNGLIEYFFPDGCHPLVLFGSLFAVLTVSYLLGSINSAILFSKLVYKDDIRKHGSGNGGMTNMLRTYGGKAALLTLAGDLGKTALSIFIAGLVFGFRYIPAGISIQGYCYFAGLFAVLGHIFPVYYRFKGGKGVLVTSTMALILSPLPFAILFGVFAAVFAMSHYVSLASVCAAMLDPVILHGTFSVMGGVMYGEIALASIILACLIVWCHRGNLQRISERTERKTYLRKKKHD